MECNCRPKLEALSLKLPLAEYKQREQIDIPKACPVHSTSGTYLHRVGRFWHDTANPLANLVRQPESSLGNREVNG